MSCYLQMFVVFLEGPAKHTFDLEISRPSIADICCENWVPFSTGRVRVKPKILHTRGMCVDPKAVAAE